MENGVLEFLEELTLEERKEALRLVNDSLKMNANLRRAGGDRSARELVEQGFGPASAHEVDDEDFSSYNGKDGGENWMWYEPSVFEIELQVLGVDVKTCTERECVIALCETSKFIRMYS